MAWYEIINAKSDSFVADRDAEDLLRHFAAAFQTAEGLVEAEGFYGLTSHGARRYYFSLSPEAVACAERVLATYDARALTAPPISRAWRKYADCDRQAWRRRETRAAQECSMNIFIGNLAFTTTEEELAQLFHPYGEIASVRIMTDRDTGRSRGFGFVDMPNAMEANAAIAGLHGTALGGRALTVNEARPREERRPRDDGDGRRRPRW